MSFSLFFLDVAVPIEDGESVVVGRSQECDVTVEADLSMSRKHARFQLRDGKVYVEDLQSRNGVLVNGRAIGEPTAIGLGDRVLIGGHVFQVIESHRRDPKQTVRLRPGKLLAAAEGDDEPTTASSPADLVDLASSFLTSGAIDMAQRHLLRLVSAIDVDRARGRPTSEPIVRSAARLLLDMAARTADVAWVDRALGVHASSKVVISDQEVDHIARLLPGLGEGATACIARYLEATRTLSTGDANRVWQRLRVLARLA